MTTKQADLLFWGVWFTISLVMVYVLDAPRFYILTGWGAARIQRFDEQQGVVTILVENGPLTSVLKPGEKPGTAICHYSRGYWVGVLSEILEERVNCSEVRCVGMGDERCEFQITAADKNLG